MTIGAPTQTRTAPDREGFAYFNWPPKFTSSPISGRLETCCARANGLAIAAALPSVECMPALCQSPLAWVWVGINTNRGRTGGSGRTLRRKVERIAKIAAYAARTPKLTEATTVKQRMTGIKSEFTSSQPCGFRCAARKSVYVPFLSPRARPFNLTALTLRASDD